MLCENSEQGIPHDYVTFLSSQWKFKTLHLNGSATLASSDLSLPSSLKGSWKAGVSGHHSLFHISVSVKGVSGALHLNGCLGPGLPSRLSP
jgi:hypothetical protein